MRQLFERVQACAEGGTLGELATSTGAAVRENIMLRRGTRVSVERGAVGSYLHNKLGDGMGGAGALVALELPAGASASPHAQSLVH